MKEKKTEYTQKECLNYCRNLKFNELIDCYNYKLNNSFEQDFAAKIRVNNYKTLENKIKKCIEKFISEIDAKPEKCFNYCPLECDSFTYMI